MPRGAKPGERRGGRAAGTPNRATQARQQRIAAEGVTPLEVMIHNMRFAHSEGLAMIQKLVGKRTVDDEVVILLREAIRLQGIAQECAKDAAPYVHPKLQSVLYGQDPSKPHKVVHEVSDATLKRVSDMMLGKEPVRSKKAA